MSELGQHTGVMKRTDRPDLANDSDLIPSFGTKLSMIFSEGKGNGHVQEQAH